MLSWAASLLLGKSVEQNPTQDRSGRQAPTFKLPRLRLDDDDFGDDGADDSIAFLDEKNGPRAVKIVAGSNPVPFFGPNALASEDAAEENSRREGCFPGVAHLRELYYGSCGSVRLWLRAVRGGMLQPPRGDFDGSQRTSDVDEAKARPLQSRAGEAQAPDAC